MRERRLVVGAMIDGAIAGAIATWVMGKATSYLYAREDQAAREREDRAREGKTAYGAAAEKLAKLTGTTLSESRRKSYGQTIHWVLGVGTGAAYATLRDHRPEVAAARGLAFGASFFLLMDEGLVYALRLTPGPTHFPWQTHARGLAGHLVFGTVTEGTLSLLNYSA